MKRLLVLTAAVVILAMAASAQSEETPQLSTGPPSPEELDEATRIRLDVTRVNILFTVSAERNCMTYRMIRQS